MIPYCSAAIRFEPRDDGCQAAESAAPDMDENVTGSTQRSSLLDRKVRLNLRLFFLIAVIMLGLLIYHVARGDGSLGWALLSLALGGVVGGIENRVNVLDWDDARHVVVSRMDALGVVVLVLYVFFLFIRDRLLGRWIDDAPLLSMIGLGLTAGTMIGRVFLTRHGIRQVLADAGMLPEVARDQRR